MLEQKQSFVLLIRHELPPELDTRVGTAHLIPARGYCTDLPLVRLPLDGLHFDLLLNHVSRIYYHPEYVHLEVLLDHQFALVMPRNFRRIFELEAAVVTRVQNEHLLVYCILKAEPRHHAFRSLFDRQLHHVHFLLTDLLVKAQCLALRLLPDPVHLVLDHLSRGRVLDLDHSVVGALGLGSERQVHVLCGIALDRDVLLLPVQTQNPLRVLVGLHGHIEVVSLLGDVDDRQFLLQDFPNRGLHLELVTQRLVDRTHQDFVLAHVRA